MHVTMVNAPLLPVPPVLGGPIERTLYETALAIDQPKMTVISPWRKEVANWEDVPEGVFYHVDRNAQARKVRDVLGEHLPDELQDRRRAGHFYYLNGVTDLLEDLNPDVVQVHNDVEAMAYLAKQFSNKKKILYMHNEPRYGGDQTAVCARVCDHFIFVSHYLADRFCKHFPECVARSQVIYNSIDVDAFCPELKTLKKTKAIRKQFALKPNRTLLFVGRTVPVKGLHCLLDAMPLVLDVLPDARLVVAGSPLFGAVAENDYLRRLKRQAEKLGHSVVFTGFVDPEALPYYYAAADVSVAPSMWGEPFGKVVAEAMASGIPVVGSDRGAIPELVDDGQMGLLVDDPKDSETLAGCLVDLLKDENRRKEMGKMARKKAVREFATDVRMKKLRVFYKSI
ncbi:MAG: spore coat protein SA [Candidatus Latescibacterota bacterium]|jgi:spore coat protein SA